MDTLMLFRCQDGEEAYEARIYDFISLPLPGRRSRLSETAQGRSLAGFPRLAITAARWARL